MSILDYLAEKKLNGAKENTLRSMSVTLRRLNDFKEIDTCTESDIKQYLSGLVVSEGTLNLYKIYIKNYFTWRGEAQKVAWIKSKKVKRVIYEDDLLTSDEIEKLLKACRNPRDAALISLLSEAGCRISEALNLNIGDLSKTDYGLKMRIRAMEGNKTGHRDIALINSVPHLVQWLNLHPLGDQPDAPLFIAESNINYHERLSASGARVVLKNLVEKAGIKKRVHPCLFRHTVMTNLARDGMPESIMRRLAGWSGSSRMPEVYVTIGNKDVENALLVRHGKAVAQKRISEIVLTKECPICHKSIPVEAQYCENCAKHQDLSPVVKRLLEEHQQVLSAQEDFKRKIESLERSIENMNMFTTLAKRSEKSWGFQTFDGAEAWEPETGNVITFKEVNGKITKSVRKPTPEDYKPDNPLLDPALVAVTLEDKNRAEEFIAKQKSLVDDLHRRGGLTSSEKAKKRTEQLEKKNKHKGQQ
ncbi:MAG: site-specific integrase [Candidatus Methanoperedens sp.]|nr:site-specific integrase [Candidatus Methanoperedens sp.]